MLFFAGINKLSHLFQGGYTNAILTSGFDISPEWFGVVLIESFLNDIIDVVDLRTLEGLLQCFWNDLNELHWFDFFARLYNLDLRRTIFFKLLLNQGKDFLFEHTLDGMFLSIECWMPSLKVFHNSSIEELLTEFMIES